MTPSEFAAKWRGVTTGERASAQSHFGDLCRMLGEPTPTDADPTVSGYAVEKGAEKFDGGDGFADVWKKGFFAWEYKGKRKDRKAAYRQLVDSKTPSRTRRSSWSPTSSGSRSTRTSPGSHRGPTRSPSTTSRQRTPPSRCGSCGRSSPSPRRSGRRSIGPS